jgi:hypothetical protein
MTMAAGPNISATDPRNPNPFPAGSIGMQRADGTYTVETADGKPQSFANEAAARANFQRIADRPKAMDAAQAFLASRSPATPGQAGLAQNGPAFVTKPNQLAASPAPSPAPVAVTRVDASPDSASQAWAANSSGRARGGATEPAFDATPVPVTPIGPSPAVQQVMAAASAPPVPVATPVNAPRPPNFRERGFPSPASAYAADMREKIGPAAPSIWERPFIALRNRQKRILADRNPEVQRARAAGKAADTDFDAGSIPNPPRAPFFGDDEPAAFPTFNAPTGTSRPRASLA